MIQKLTHRTVLEANGASVPPHVAVTDASDPVVGDVNYVVVGTEGSVSNPTEFYDHLRQYDRMDMSVNEQVPRGSKHGEQTKSQGKGHETNYHNKEKDDA
ncbi:hypothetical protein Bca52824_000863 [Brassica carinata]|uniref:Uncharacterized protein n=1 Tax=Brassica carinata TaxID=52824 RepID=A0A8X7WKB8_BRACI|nr:hypothetical protein Bca52824_000863 [Brassica carinata]